MGESSTFTPALEECRKIHMIFERSPHKKTKFLVFSCHILKFLVAYMALNCNFYIILAIYDMTLLLTRL